jgi:hypothetical protein
MKNLIFLLLLWCPRIVGQTYEGWIHNHMTNAFEVQIGESPGDSYFLVQPGGEFVLEDIDVGFGFTISGVNYWWASVPGNTHDRVIHLNVGYAYGYPAVRDVVRETPFYWFTKGLLVASGVLAIRLGLWIARLLKGNNHGEIVADI